MKVDFMVVGAMKCGTTTLIDSLREHRDVCISNPKEPQYFSTVKNWRDGLNEYHSKFKNPEGKICGEGSTTYTKAPHYEEGICRNLYEYNSDLKFIYVVRDPFSQIISHYMHAYERGYTDLGLSDALKKFPLMINTARYFSQITPFIETFGRNRVVIVDFADIVKSKTDVVLRILKFLDLEDYDGFRGNVSEKHSNASLRGEKNHHKFDNPNLALRVIRKFMPQLWNYILKKNRRPFAEKPKLSVDEMKWIKAELNDEVISVGALACRDFSDWFACID